MLILKIDQEAAVPPFEQLRRQIITAVNTGQLVAGSRLTPVRKLADELGIAPNTVARTYRLLEQSGVIETRGRNGSYVRGTEAVTRAAAELTRKYVQSLRGLNVPEAEALLLLSAAYRGDDQGP